MSKTSKPQAEATEAAEASPDRRAALRRLGGYALSVAPAMVVLTSGSEANNGRGGGNGKGNGNGNSGGNGEPQTPCHNPAWQLGLKRAGHSGC